MVKCAVKRYKPPPFEIRGDGENCFVICVWNTAEIFRSAWPRNQVREKSVSSIFQFQIADSTEGQTEEMHGLHLIDHKNSIFTDISRNLV